METYFHKRAADLGEGNQAYLPCKKMELCARKKDLQGLWKLMERYRQNNISHCA